MLDPMQYQFILSKDGVNIGEQIATDPYWAVVGILQFKIVSGLVDQKDISVAEDGDDNFVVDFGDDTYTLTRRIYIPRIR